MIIKKALIELVRDRITGEYEAKQIGKVSDRKLAYYIGRAYNSLLTAQLVRRMTNLDPYTKEYQDVSVSQDTNTQIYYSELPAAIIPVPRMAGNGVVRIKSTEGTSVEYAPITNGNLKVIDGLEVDQIDDVVGYVFKNGRVEYKGMTDTLASSTVCMELIPTFEAYDNDDYVSLPTGSDEALIQQVAQFLVNKPDADKINDGNSVNKNMVNQNQGR